MDREQERLAGSQDRMTEYTRRHRSACLRCKQGGESRFEKRAGGFAVWPQRRGRTEGVCSTTAAKS